LLENKPSSYSYKHSLNYNYNHHFNKITLKDLKDEEVKKKVKILIRTNQKIVNQKDLSLKIKEATLREMIKKSRNASDVRLYGREYLYIS